MKRITISSEMKERVPEVALGCIECDVDITGNNEALWAAIESAGEAFRSAHVIADICKVPAISASRKAYKACGKDPARYRLSAEALLRRVVKSQDLYRINTVVDLVNLVSIETGISIGGYDVEKIEGAVVFGIGEQDEPYEGLGRGVLNIAGMPVFRDTHSAFGSPTSDSPRTCVTDQTERFLMIFIAFEGEEAAIKSIEVAVSALREFASATNFETEVVI